MRTKTILALASAFLAAAVASAQTKMSGTISCKDVADQSHKVDLEDAKGHAIAIGKSMCTWTKGFELAGSTAKDGWSTAMSEVSGNKATEHGFHTSTLASGDKVFVRFQGTTTMKDGKPTGDKGTWSFTGGTGKAKGLKGKGTFEGKPEADGSMTYQVEGEYSLP
jgi:hypothetical protein